MRLMWIQRAFASVREIKREKKKAAAPRQKQLESASCRFYFRYRLFQFSVYSEPLNPTHANLYACLILILTFFVRFFRTDFAKQRNVQHKNIEK